MSVFYAVNGVPGLAHRMAQAIGQYFIVFGDQDSHGNVSAV
jgi:hypothetical protein